MTLIYFLFVHKNNTNQVLDQNNGSKGEEKFEGKGENFIQ